LSTAPFQLSLYRVRRNFDVINVFFMITMCLRAWATLRAISGLGWWHEHDVWLCVMSWCVHARQRSRHKCSSRREGVEMKERGNIVPCSLHPGWWICSLNYIIDIFPCVYVYRWYIVFTLRVTRWRIHIVGVPSSSRHAIVRPGSAIVKAFHVGSSRQAAVHSTTHERFSSELSVFLTIIYLTELLIGLSKTWK
jgi:hypothetical protein